MNSAVGGWIKKVQWNSSVRKINKLLAYRITCHKKVKRLKNLGQMNCSLVCLTMGSHLFINFFFFLNLFEGGQKDCLGGEGAGQQGWPPKSVTFSIGQFQSAVSIYCQVQEYMAKLSKSKIVDTRKKVKEQQHKPSFFSIISNFDIKVDHTFRTG